MKCDGLVVVLRLQNPDVVLLADIPDLAVKSDAVKDGPASDYMTLRVILEILGYMLGLEVRVQSV